MRIWGRRNAQNVQKVMWLVGELGLAHEHIPAGGDFGGLDDPAFLALNPHGRIPVLEDGPAVIWESHSILRYLAGRHAPNAFWSNDPADRARQEAWMDWAQTALQPAFLNGVFWGYYRTPEHLRDWSAIRASLTRCAALWSVVDRVLSAQPFLAGETLGLADLPAGALLFRYFELDIQRPSLPNVEAWYARLSARPAYREHVMTPFEDLRGRLDF